ncbi:MAG: YdbL family protein [Planctomycetes bacterium]|nr:YdbL family protein [Planctomycetota bacterium]
MNRMTTRPACLALLAIVTGCFYVTVNFPATELEALARKMAREYYQSSVETADPNSTVPSPESTDAKEPPKTGFLASLFDRPVYAAELALQDKPINLNASSPAVKKIQASQKERLEKLKPLYEKGLVGILKNGNLGVREIDGVTLKDKTEARRLVDAENADRSALYRELAVANDISAADVPRIQSIFAKKWVEEAPVGYWYQDEKENWVQVKPKK